MKTRNYISIILGAALLASCTKSDVVDFRVDTNEIAAAADGGTHVVRISAGENWVASTAAPWITVSPANGRGSVDCKILIDSALTAETRSGVVRFENQSNGETMQINVSQKGYAYSVTLDDDNSQVEIPNYAFVEERHFDVEVRSNVDFDIDIPDNAREWLTYDKYEVKLDRGLRPRKTTVRFNWGVSPEPAERTARVKFTPKNVTAERLDDLLVRQQAAPEIEAGTRAGDSVALICIARALNTWYTWESSEPMDNWSSVTLWEEGMECPDSCIGRVRSADFFLFDTKEGIPQEVQYLTAAESLSFRSNVNSSIRDLTPGEYITRLHHLKRLSIWAYGLTDIDEESFSKLENLEYLDLAANNFADFPQVLRNGRKHFKRLHALVLNANQRNLALDIGYTNLNHADLGGFIDATHAGGEFPRWLMEWEELDTLVLGVNYLQGQFPDLRDGWPTYDEADVANSKNDKGVDTLPAGRFNFDWNRDNSFDEENTPEGIIGLPKVWPNMKLLTINYNRMNGTLPDWLLFHPALDWWMPFTFIFNYEGKNEAGQTAKFDNEPPTTMGYYYKFYKEKKNPYADYLESAGGESGDCDCGCKADCSCDSCNK